MDKKILYSAVKPTTDFLTLGNYLGAVKSWRDWQDNDDYDCIFGIADLHALTVRQVPAVLRARTLSFIAQYLACGLSPEKNTVYIQSHVHEHAELCWVLNCFTYVGEASRMTQFKEKSAKNADNINMGLMDYPVLMAADILLYKTDLVPVGEDQRQHLEIARDIAERFNNLFSDTFTIPEGFTPKSGARIKSLADPTVKMSKTDDNENATVTILDTPDAIMRKFKRAVTDSGSDIIAADDKPGITNLLNIYCECAGCTLEAAQNEFLGKNYAQFKQSVGEAVVSVLEPIQAQYKRLIADKAYLKDVVKQGADKASYLARKTLAKVYRKVGLVEG